MLSLETIQTVIDSHKNQLDKFTNGLADINVKNSIKRKSLESVQQMMFDSVDKSIKTDIVSTLRCVNIGGKILAFDLKSAALVTNKILFSLLSGKYDNSMPKDEKGRIFLDFDFNWIEPEFDLLRDLAMWDGTETNCPIVAPTISPLKCDHAEFVAKCLTSVMNATRSVIQDGLSKSLILSKLPAESVSSLRNMLPTRQRSVSSKLLYRSSRDGLTRSSFHACSKGHKNTLVVIEDTDGNVFGGYSDVEFRDEECNHSSKEAFLFSLQKNGNYNPVKLVQKESSSKSHAVWNRKEYIFAFGGGSDLKVSSSDSACYLGYSYELLNGSKTLVKENRIFSVVELELFAIEEANYITDSDTNIDAKQVAFACDSLDLSIESELLQIQQSSEIMLNSVVRCHKQLIQSSQELTTRACALRDELYCVANFIGLSVPSDVVGNKGQNMSDDELFSCTLTEIETMIRLITDSKVNNDDVSCGAKSIVYINAGGKVMAVSKATLLQAPSGSILANMASDVWGHDLDSDGNIIQDVNPVLFTAIVNHMRLKTLGAKMGMTDIPPIVIYAEQKNALKNLLSFYMLTDIPVREIKAKMETVSEYVL